MSRMLKALQQIEAKSSNNTVVFDSPPPCASGSPDGPSVQAEPEPSTPPVCLAAEATLSQAELALAMDADLLVDEVLAAETFPAESLLIEPLPVLAESLVIPRDGDTANLVNVEEQALLEDAETSSDSDPAGMPVELAIDAPCPAVQPSAASPKPGQIPLVPGTSAENTQPIPSGSALADLADQIVSQLPAAGSAVLMFTSPCDGSGKSHALPPLAHALVERVKGEVLLVDGNFSRPELTEALEVAAPRGLADILLADAAWSHLVHRTGTPRLSLLPGVASPDLEGRSADGLLWRPLLRQLRDHFSLILLDAASLAHAGVAHLARYCDGVYLVVRLGGATCRQLNESVQNLGACGGRLLGCVVVTEPGVSSGS